MKSLFGKQSALAQHLYRKGALMVHGIQPSCSDLWIIPFNLKAGEKLSFASRDFDKDYLRIILDDDIWFCLYT